MPADEFDSSEEAHAAPEQDRLPWDEVADEVSATQPPTPAPEDEEILLIIEELDSEEGVSAAESLEGAETPELPFENPEDEPDETAEAQAGPAEASRAAEEPAQSEGELASHPPQVARAPLWPFIVYDLVWLAFAAFVAWQLLALPTEVGVYDSALYETMLYAGVMLTAAGPLLILVTWLFARKAEGGSAGGSSYPSW